MRERNLWTVESVWWNMRGGKCVCGEREGLEKGGGEANLSLRRNDGRFGA